MLIRESDSARECLVPGENYLAVPLSASLCVCVYLYRHDASMKKTDSVCMCVCISTRDREECALNKLA